jgi:hypothetical protein
MAIVVVGGHSRNIGKTSVVAGLITALAAYSWTAFKITQLEQGEGLFDDKPCDSVGERTCWAITEERDRSGKSDSSRFLVAGAKSAFWVRTEQGRLEEAMPAIQQKFAEAEDVIIESNSILEFIHPDLYITVLDPATEDFKTSAQKYLDRADAVVLHDSGEPRWQGISPDLNARPIFRIVPPQYVNADLVEFVAQRLKVKSGSYV